MKEFWKNYFFMLLSFLTGAILIQIDLLFIAPLGKIATAAFVIPNKLMIIDPIVAFALGPVISVAVSRCKDTTSKIVIIRQSLGLTLFLSVILMLLGLVIYPLILEQVVTNFDVTSLARPALFWMTVSIPIRMIVFISSMILFACGQGKKVSYIYAITIGSNIIFNYVMIYSLKTGFEGVYISTFIVSIIEMIWLLYLLIHLTKTMPFGFFGLDWIKSLFAKIGAEWLRLISWQGEGLVIIAILAYKEIWLTTLSIFGVTNDFSTLLFMPLIALMRYTSMYIAKINPDKNLSQAKQQAVPILKQVIPISATLGLILIILSSFLGKNAYHLSEVRLDWWTYFIILTGICLPSYCWGYIQRAYFQACDLFSVITKIDIFLTWLILIPGIIFSVYAQSPLGFFGCFVIRSLAFNLFIFLYEKNKLKSF